MLVVLAFPRYGSEVGLEGIVWFALVPLMAAAAGRGAGRGFLLGLCAGAILEAAGFIWILHAIRSFTGMSAPIASLCFLGWLLAESLPWALLGLVLGKAREPAGVLWALPFWVVLEHFYPRLFPWHLGGALHAREWLVQNADLVGASGLTALVFLSNAVIHLLVRFLRGRSAFPWASSLAFLVFLTGSLVYGFLRIRELRAVLEDSPQVRVACIQLAVAPLERRETARVYLEATRSALSLRPLDLVVWPEGADPHWFDLTPGKDPWSRHREARDRSATLLPETLRAPLVTGAAGRDTTRMPPWSGIAAYLRPGEKPIFYEKNYRLLFGEYIPLIPPSWLEALGAPASTLAAGTTNPPCPLGAATFKNLICYEAVLPDYVRRTSEGADFLVNITEDMWYGRTAHIPQHVSVLVLRVVECRIPLVRAANVGPSGVFDITGRFHPGEKIFEPETVFGVVKARSPSSLFRRGGHHFPLLLGILLCVRWGWRAGICPFFRRKLR
ncbi:MAG TPA: apolipoprotein N-acyltransferase [Planctomycetota bacterium]|nr:apolipoprotein N-acyltransferase [Planctomycetota bacterium]